jgi:hypothetical protein
MWLWTILVFKIDIFMPIQALKQHGRLLFSLGGLVWNYAALMLVVCEMTNSKYPSRVVVTNFMLLFLPLGVLFLWREAYAITAFKVATLIALIRYISLWLQFLHEIVHYCGMGTWYAIQPWTHKVPNVARLEDDIEYLGAGGGDISDWGVLKAIKQSRTEALMNGEIVKLMD